MPLTYETEVRVAGSADAVRKAHKLLLQAEAEHPSATFEIVLNDGDAGASGLVACALANGAPPSLLHLVLADDSPVRALGLTTQMCQWRDSTHEHRWTFLGGTLLHECVGEYAPLASWPSTRKLTVHREEGQAHAHTFDDTCAALGVRLPVVT
jgi:hypothetical protein